LANSFSEDGADDRTQCYCRKPEIGADGKLQAGYYFNYARYGSGEQRICDQCPAEGVVCPGGFRNETTRMHALPYALPNYYMTRLSAASRCNIEYDVGTTPFSACQPESCTGLPDANQPECVDMCDPVVRITGLPRRTWQAGTSFRQPDYAIEGSVFRSETGTAVLVAVYTRADVGSPLVRVGYPIEIAGEPAGTPTGIELVHSAEDVDGKLLPERRKCKRCKPRYRFRNSIDDPLVETGLTDCCIDGHHGFMCGSCERGYTRDKYPAQCESCSDLINFYLGLMSIVSTMSGNVIFNVVVTSFALQNAARGTLGLHSALVRIWTQWLITCGVLKDVDLSRVELYTFTKAAMQSSGAAGGKTIQPVQELTVTAQAMTDSDPTVEEIVLLLNSSTADYAIAPFTITSDSVDTLTFVWKDNTTNIIMPLLQLYVDGDDTAAFVAERDPAQDEGEHQETQTMVITDPLLLANNVLVLRFTGDMEISTGSAEEVDDPSAFRMKVPAFFKQWQAQLFAFAGSLPQLAQPQQIFECFVENYLAASPPGSNSLKIKYILPALYWLAYNWILLFWTGCVSLALVFIAYPLGKCFLPAQFPQPKTLDDIQEMRESPPILGTFVPETFDPKTKKVRMVSMYDIVFRQAIPLYWITLYNSWMPVNTRYLLILQCESLAEQELVVRHGADNSVFAAEIGRFTPTVEVREMPSISRWKHDTEIMCDYSVNGQPYFTLFVIAFVGFAIQIGMFVVLFRKLHKINRESGGDGMYQTHVVRNYGYFFLGFEPDRWWWEIMVKRLDILLVSLIQFLPVLTDFKAKLIMYSFLGGMMWTMNALVKPYDDRQNELLDRVENKALRTRFLTFCLVQVLLVFNGGEFMSFLTAGLILYLIVSFNIYIFIHTATQFAMNIKQNEIEKQRKKQFEAKRGIIRGETEEEEKEVEQEPQQAKTGLLALGSKQDGKGGKKKKSKKKNKDDESSSKELEMLLKVVCGPFAKVGVVLARRALAKLSGVVSVIHDSMNDGTVYFDWIGPGKGMRVAKPSKAQGAATWVQRKKDEFFVWFYNIGYDDQLEFAANSIGGFAARLLVLLQLPELPSNFVDVCLLWALAVKNLSAVIDERLLAEESEQVAQLKKRMEEGTEFEDDDHHHETDAELVERRRRERLQDLKNSCARVLSAVEAKYLREMLGEAYSGQVQDEFRLNLICGPEDVNSMLMYMVRLSQEDSLDLLHWSSKRIAQAEQHSQQQQRGWDHGVIGLFGAETVTPAANPRLQNAPPTQLSSHLAAQPPILDNPSTISDSMSISDSQLLEDEEELLAVLGEGQVTRLRKLGIVGNGATTEVVRREPQVFHLPAGDPIAEFAGDDESGLDPRGLALPTMDGEPTVPPTIGPKGTAGAADLADLLGAGEFAEVQALINDDLEQLAETIAPKSSSPSGDDSFGDGPHSGMLPVPQPGMGADPLEAALAQAFGDDGSDDDAPDDTEIGDILGAERWAKLKDVL